MNKFSISDKAIVLMDIDGTIKDLTKENTDALLRTMHDLNIADSSIRSKLVLSINKVNMYLVKTGLLPTNSTMQNILLFIYAVMLFKNYAKLKETYFGEYNKEDIFFDSAEPMVKKLFGNGSKLYFVTKNKQNVSILNSDFAGKYNKALRLVVGRKGFTKYIAYKDFINHRNYNKSSLVIIGDNLFDDVVPAMLLGIKVIWCDMYNCKLKRLVYNVLKIFYSKISMQNINEI